MMTLMATAQWTTTATTTTTLIETDDDIINDKRGKKLQILTNDGEMRT